MKSIHQLLEQPAAPSSRGVPPLFPMLPDLNATGLDEPVMAEPASPSTVGKKRGEGMAYAKQRAEAIKAQQGQQQELLLQEGFPLWNDGRRGVPNPLIRGGLFTTRRTPDRENLQLQTIVSLSNFAIRYSGTELRQDDLSVWLSIVNLGRVQPLGSPIYFTAYSLIKDMGWRLHSESYAKIKDCIERMKATSLRISTAQDRDGYAGSLIRDYAFNTTNENGDARWMVRLEERVAKLFTFDQTTLIEWEQRRKIGSRALLTLWLHTFYSSHKEPIPYKVAKLHELCRSEEKNMANFKIRVRQSMEKLIDVGLLESYKITDDVVHVIRQKFPTTTEVMLSQDN